MNVQGMHIIPTLLFADISPLVTEGVLSLLRPSYNVIAICSNGEEALARAEQLRPNFAVLDLSLPILDGITVARRLRLAESRTRVVLTSLIEDEDIIAEARLVANGYVLKRYLLQDLPVALACAAKGLFFAPRLKPQS